MSDRHRTSAHTASGPRGRIRRYFTIGLGVALLLPLAAAASAGTIADANLLRGQAQYEAANAAYAQLLHDQPRNGQVWFDYGYSLSLQAVSEPNSATAGAIHRRSYAAAARARELGISNAILTDLLREQDSKGDDLRGPFAANPQAEAALRRGEQLFSQGRFDDALTAYSDALKIDPVNYSGELFTGDVYFNQKNYAAAIGWFAKAAETNPNRETAHRYMGDALAKEGRRDEALSQYIEAVIAEPSSQYSRAMLDQFSTLLNRPIHHPPVAVPAIFVELKDRKVKIGYDPTGSPLFLAYALGRATWLTQERGRYFSPLTPPRHSLPEECAGLRRLVTTADQMGAKKLESIPAIAGTLAALKALDRDGFLEAFVCLDRSDAGIAQDYPAYREEHRVQLERYVHEVWFSRLP